MHLITVYDISYELFANFSNDNVIVVLTMEVKIDYELIFHFNVWCLWCGFHAAPSSFPMRCGLMRRLLSSTDRERIAIQLRLVSFYQN